MAISRLDHPLFLAPLSGITDYPFRKLAREFGCGLVFTEMVSAEGLLRKGKPLLKMGEDEHPVSAQLSGSTPEALARAAEMAEAGGSGCHRPQHGMPLQEGDGHGRRR